VKLSKVYPLKTNNIFVFGTTHILVTFPSHQNRKGSYDRSLMEKKEQFVDATNTIEKYSTIKLEVIHGCKKKEVFEYNSHIKKVVKIGRKEHIPVPDIVFDDVSISRIQCTLFYNKKHWFLVDSDGKQRSTNGSWLLADDYIEIHNKMIFRAGLSTFEAHYKNLEVYSFRHHNDMEILINI